jgi:hypothetical protein
LFCAVLVSIRILEFFEVFGVLFVIQSEKSLTDFPNNLDFNARTVDGTKRLVSIELIV